MKYTVSHNVDSLGGTYIDGSPTDLETDDLKQAIALAEKLTSRGKAQGEA